MKVTINYKYMKRHPLRSWWYFTVSKSESKMPRDYIVYAVVSLKKFDYYLIEYDNKMAFIPEFFVEFVDSTVESDWVYFNYIKKNVIKDMKYKLVISKYLGPVMFLEDKKFLIDVVKEEVSITEFNFMYNYNLPHHTNGKYSLNVDNNEIGILNLKNEKSIAKKICKFKLDRFKKEIYIICEIDSKKYGVINYVSDKTVFYKSLDEMNVEYKFIFENNNDFIKF